jgi:hypothetical protein
MDLAVNELFRSLNQKLCCLKCQQDEIQLRLCQSETRGRRTQQAAKENGDQLQKYDSRLKQQSGNLDYLQENMGAMQQQVSQLLQQMSLLQQQMYVLQQYLTSYNPYSGHGNNLANPTWGATGTPLRRKATPAYGDGSSALAVRGAANPDPRLISNAICKQVTSIKNSHGLTDMVWIWGQFIDHEIDLTDTGMESANMTTPDLGTDPTEEYPNRTILFSRSKFISGTDPREQPNDISSFIDGGVVYGSSVSRAYELRLLDGTGRLKRSTADNSEDLLPYNVNGLPNAQDNPMAPASDFFISGDVRANENVFLTSMHTLFNREHNRLCDEIVANQPGLLGQDELIYQRARKKVSALLQHITYSEYLPCLLGTSGLPPYPGYNPSVDAAIFNEFSAAVYRLGHSMLSSSLKVDSSGTTIQLRTAFFNPAYVQQNGIDDLIYGGTDQLMERIDGRIVDDVRSFLFGPPTATNLLDLASINIQRGRDHGLPDYNSVRVAFGLAAKTSFTEISSDPTVSTALDNLYGGDVGAVDPWIGALVEDHFNGLPVGELVYTVLGEQFTRLRDGDRFWYENNQFDASELEEIRATRLSDVIHRNTKWNSLRSNVFKM